jgi:dTDP-glucose pyrophosphorylase
MIDIKKHSILFTQTISEALFQLNELGQELTLFVVQDDGVLLGALTDGDIRRGLLKKRALTDTIDSIMNVNFLSLHDGTYDFKEIEKFKERQINIIPVIDDEKRIVKILNLSDIQSILPIDVVIMAGGEGMRLRPLTESVPKPLLIVGDKPILEHNIDRLITFGVQNFWLCIRYLGEQIQNYFKDGSTKGINVKYITEESPLGTIGAVNRISSFDHDNVLILNSDILTNIDYHKFYLDFVTSNADLSVVTIPYSVNIPYAVLETSNGHVLSFKEKPTYTYYSNGGIYLIRKKIFDYIPNGFFNATDLMELLIQKGYKVTSYPLRGYWLDIGKPEDYQKANEDIKHLKF